MYNSIILSNITILISYFSMFILFFNKNCRCKYWKNYI